MTVTMEHIATGKTIEEAIEAGCAALGLDRDSVSVEVLQTPSKGFLFGLGAQDAKVLNRELGRLETSLKAAGDREKLVFLHYPPLYQGYQCPEILQLLQKYGVKRCWYGHLHGGGCRLARTGNWEGITFSLISADHLEFVPKKICE